MMLAIKRSYLC